MTGFLASVSSLQEARVVLAAGVDIIDLKQPENGALGAVSGDVISEVVDFIDGRRMVSATVGDLVADADIVCPVVEWTAACGVDIVKVGLFDGGDQKEYLLRAIGDTATGKVKIVIVAFADRGPDLGLLDHIAEAGIAGVMLDTADKRNGTLCNHASTAQLREFVGRAKALGLMTGLAGSLCLDDVPPLLDLAPDYLGFRGALCRRGERLDTIDSTAVRAVRSAIPAKHVTAMSEEISTG